MSTAAAQGKMKKSDIVEALSSFDKVTIRRYRKDHPSACIDHIPGGNGIPVV